MISMLLLVVCFQLYIQVRVKHCTRLASSWYVYCITAWCSFGHPLSRRPSLVYLTVCSAATGICVSTY